MKPLRIFFTIIFVVLLSACDTQDTATWLESKYRDDTSQFITIDGNRVHYRDEGLNDQHAGSAMDQEVIILMHGTASSLHTWDQWVAKLTDQYRVIRMDLPGFGLTGPDRSHRYEVADDVAFLSAFLKALDIQKAHMVGSSLGGRIVWQYALDFPQQVKSLTLMNALGYPQASWPPPIEMGQWPIVGTLMEYVSPRFMFEVGLKEVYYDSTLVDDELVDRYFELSRYPGNLGAFPKRVKAKLDQDSELIPQIEVPTLILWGESDIYFPVVNAHRFNQDISGSQLQTYTNVGHLPMEEVPQISVGHFYKFIRGLHLDYDGTASR